MICFEKGTCKPSWVIARLDTRIHQAESLVRVVNASVVLSWVPSPLLGLVVSVTGQIRMAIEFQKRLRPRGEVTPGPSMSRHQIPISYKLRLHFNILLRAPLLKDRTRYRFRRKEIAENERIGLR
jgi:hypothetical protein